MLIPYENDLIRFFSVRSKINQKRKRIDEQKRECLRLIKDDTKQLSKQELSDIKERWNKIAFDCEVDPIWHRLYSNKTGNFSLDYVPNELHFYFTEYKLINFAYLRGFTDKNYLGLLFNDIKQPDTVVRCINGFFYKGNYSHISQEEAINIVCNNMQDGVVIKPSINSWAGRNILFLEKKLMLDEIDNIFSNFGKNFIVQRVLKQHKSLSAIHKNSVNTIRVITIIIEEEVVILSAVLRMGVGNNKVDNFSQGGIACGIDKTGQLCSVAYDHYGNRVNQHPNGFKFQDCTIPGYNEMISQVRQAAMRVPQFGVASWDFAVDENGVPVLIEYNVGKGSIDIHQYNNGPLYGENTDKIIDYVFKNYHFEYTTIQYNYLVFNDHITVNNGSKDMKIIWIKEKYHGTYVTRIGEHAFEKAKVKYIFLPNSLQYIDYCAFYNCKELRYIKLSKSLKIIGRSAFNGCCRLKSIKIPFGVTSIGTYAFKDVGDIKIYIPQTVNSIADNCFENCHNVKIYGKQDSYAQIYAERKKYKFCPVG